MIHSPYDARFLVEELRESVCYRVKPQSKSMVPHWNCEPSITQQSPIKTTHSKLRRSMMETAVCRTSYRLLSKGFILAKWPVLGFCYMRRVTERTTPINLTSISCKSRLPQP